MPERILVGFSGGVDSAVTALLLRELGHDVVAATMLVRDASGRGCGRVGDEQAAADLAAALGIQHHVFDLSDAYADTVLRNFREEYLAGRTPNPCVICNPYVKFRLIPDMARAAGIRFDRFATGHYARIEPDETGRPRLLRGVDRSKDQSYFLYRLSPEQLAGTVFPLGAKHKDDVRDLARHWNVPVSDKPDSQDFYAGDYADLLGLEEAPGDIVDPAGRVLGRHRGFWHYTVGQRKGLGVAYREPLYVIRLEPDRNRVVVGTRDDQMTRRCAAESLVFPHKVIEVGMKCQGRIRSAQPLRDLTVTALADDRIEVEFREPVHGIAPGQSLVLYDGDVVLGGGFISGRTAVPQ
ncbi:MAG: tRNA 2-thiouridine(34) synthase MnmA [Planctomycetes bacterium]|nr:tRNA 2-thiouridine(34) synthase MnmA [Planctomycetota bacterium]